MRITCIIVLLSFILSCNKEAEPTPTEEPVLFTVGDLENELASYFEVDQEIFMASVTGRQEFQVDIDEDARNDLRFVIETNIEDQIQEIRVLPLDGLSIGSRETAREMRAVATVDESAVLVPEDISWSTGELLFAYRASNQFTLPYRIFEDEQGFLPLLKRNQVGWLSFRLGTGAGEALARLNLLTYSRNNE